MKLPCTSEAHEVLPRAQQRAAKRPDASLRAELAAIFAAGYLRFLAGSPAKPGRAANPKDSRRLQTADSAPIELLCPAPGVIDQRVDSRNALP